MNKTPTQEKETGTRIHQNPIHNTYRYRKAALRLGGLWVRNRNGESWLEGDFGPTLRIIVRPNKKKRLATNEPDYEMFLNKRLSR